MLFLESRTIIPPYPGIHYAVFTSIKQTTDLHTHDFFELFLVAEGSVDHLVNGQKVRLTAGSLVFIRPDDRHAYGKYGEDRCMIVNLAFTEAVVSDIAAFLGEDLPLPELLTVPLPPVAELTSEESNRFSQRLESLIVETSAGRPASRAAMRLFLADTLNRYFNRSDEPDSPERAVPSWLAGLFEAMHAKENFTAGIDALYGMTDKTPEYICRMTRKHYHQTPTEKINGIRLAYADHLLTHSDADVLTVALECGFSNLSHFYHLFKKNYGTSPSAHRKVMQMNVIPQGNPM